ncbi:hypothetical protein ECZU03_12640 [Escherichia coli]|nr:hypothetical protein ECZU03_12640 [Escherichia coli]
MADEITLGVFRPTAVYGPGDKELKPLFDWMLRGLLPRLGAPDTQLSFCTSPISRKQWVSG